MTPNIDERLASVIRSLTEVILPHLPPEASLAQEQVQLAIGHLQILRLQLDAIPGFEADELTDARTLAAALVGAVDGGPATRAAIEALRGAAEAATGTGAQGRDALRAVHGRIEGLIGAVSIDGAPAAGDRLHRTILDHESLRVSKDRRWFLPYGFDTMEEAS